MDDCLKSVPSPDEAIDQTQDLRDLMLRGGFKLTKWISNNRKVLESIPEDLRIKKVKDLDLRKTLPMERALGVKWCVGEDTLGLDVTIKDRPLTRRYILSVVSLLYDPLGLASPFVLSAKVLSESTKVQDLCRENLGWDDEISDRHKTIWQKWLETTFSKS